MLFRSIEIHLEFTAHTSKFKRLSVLVPNESLLLIDVRSGGSCCPRIPFFPPSCTPLPRSALLTSVCLPLTPMHPAFSAISIVSTQKRMWMTCNRQYTNPYYHGGSYDNASTVSLPALVATASSLATALHAIASKGSVSPIPPLKVGCAVC